MLAALIVSLGSPVSAADMSVSPSAPFDEVVVEQASTGGSRSGGSSGSSPPGGSKGDTSSASDTKKSTGGGKGKTGKKGTFMGWTYQPYVSPGGGVQITGSGSSVVAGADVGLKYWRSKWAGNLYAGGSYLTGNGVTGYEGHVGDTTGARLKYWGVSGGAELFYDAQFDASGASLLDPSFGLGIPVAITAGPSNLYATAGIEPAWLFNDARKGGANVPFGDEFTWSVGAGAKLAGLRAQVGFAQRITSAGTFNTPTVSVSFQ